MQRCSANARRIAAGSGPMREGFTPAARPIDYARFHEGVMLNTTFVFVVLVFLWALAHRR